jgi:hypothetical protein
VDASLAVITPPPQGSGHQPWQAVKRRTSSPCSDFDEQMITQRAGGLPLPQTTRAAHDFLGAFKEVIAVWINPPTVKEYFRNLLTLLPI